MKKQIFSFSLTALALLMTGCGSSDGVAPVQAQNQPMTAERAAELSKPDPNLSAEQNKAKGDMAQEQLNRDKYYSQKYGNGAGKP